VAGNVRQSCQDVGHCDAQALSPYRRIAPGLLGRRPATAPLVRGIFIRRALHPSGMQEIIALSCCSRKFPVNLGQDNGADKESWAWPLEFFSSPGEPTARQKR
jgi:hypothetical protein